MRKRYPVAVGGGIALLVASQYLDFGLGFRSGSDSGNGPGDAAGQAKLDAIDNALDDVDLGRLETQPDPDSTMGMDMLPTDATESTATDSISPAEPAEPEVVDILIDANQYWVVRNGNQPDKRVPMTIDEILAMADVVPGEPSGIRVRVARTPDAVASAEAAMLTRLDEAGLTKDQIDSRRQLVENAVLP